MLELVKEYLYGSHRHKLRSDGFIVEGIWKDDELNGFARIMFTNQNLPKLLDPNSYATTILSYEGYLKDSRLSGTGKVV